jgi:tetratricopeptide (TPR) repeat protein
LALWRFTALVGVKFNLTYFRLSRTAFVVVLVLAVTGLAVRPLESPAWNWVRAQQPALKLDSLQGALGQGLTVGLLGGFRAIAADFFWLKTNSVWEDKDLPATQTLIKLVTAIDPRPLYFWLNGSRMIAYDMPNWRIVAAGGYHAVPQAQQRRIDEEQAALAIQYLNEAFAYHPDATLLHIEIGNIYMNRLKDYAAAAACYRRVTELPNAPFFASRIYAVLLRKSGRKEEAYVWLKQVYARLPKRIDPAQGVTERTVDAAMAPLVLAQIRELEGELNITGDKVFTE